MKSESSKRAKGSAIAAALAVFFFAAPVAAAPAGALVWAVGGLTHAPKIVVQTGEALAVGGALIPAGALGRKAFHREIEEAERRRMAAEHRAASGPSV